MKYANIIFNLLPDTFSRKETGTICKIIMNEDGHPQKIRRMMSDYIVATEELSGKYGRPNIVYKRK